MGFFVGVFGVLREIGRRSENEQDHSQVEAPSEEEAGIWCRLRGRQHSSSFYWAV